MQQGGTPQAPAGKLKKPKKLRTKEEKTSFCAYMVVLLVLMLLVTSMIISSVWDSKVANCFGLEATPDGETPGAFRWCTCVNPYDTNYVKYRANTTNTECLFNFRHQVYHSIQAMRAANGVSIGFQVAAIVVIATSAVVSFFNKTSDKGAQIAKAVMNVIAIVFFIVCVVLQGSSMQHIVDTQALGSYTGMTKSWMLAECGNNDKNQNAATATTKDDFKESISYVLLIVALCLTGAAAVILAVALVGFSYSPKPLTYQTTDGTRIHLRGETVLTVYTNSNPLNIRVDAAVKQTDGAAMRTAVESDMNNVNYTEAMWKEYWATLPQHEQGGDDQRTQPGVTKAAVRGYYGRHFVPNVRTPVWPGPGGYARVPTARW
jgi:lysylphosphatidylglycerol synthetase-like protein (DUF2156 family)